MHSSALPGALVLGRPQPKQALFLKDTHKHVGFGGARGGGKSWALRFKAILLCMNYPGIKVAIVRTTYPEVQKNHIEPLKKALCPGYAVFNESRKEFKFFNGSTIYIMYCDSDRAAERFNGLEVDVLMLDEATHFRKEHLDKMRACVRGANSYPKRIYYTCNPDGVSMGYIKRIFIDKVYEDGEDPSEYSFIQSLLTDNEILMKSDPSYMKYLESLPPSLRQAWLLGDWDCMEGMYFDEFRATPDPIKCANAGITIEEAMASHRYTHVIRPFDIPGNWNIHRSYDWGYGKPFSVGYWAVDFDDNAYRILEVYGRTKTPNEGVRWTNKQQFKYLRELEDTHPWLKGKRIQGVADPSIWDGSHDGNGISAAEEADKLQIWFEPGNNERIAGWMQFRERLKFDENGKAKIYFFDTCKDSIRTIPLMMHDETKVEDLDSSLEDHACDEIRYFCMSRPIAPRIIEPEKIIMSDPLDQFKQKQTEWSAYNAITRR